MSASTDSSGGDGRRAALHAPIRPRRSRRIALGVAVAQGLLMLAMAVFLPWGGPADFRWWDRLGLLLLAAAVAWVLLLFAGVRAVPSESGLEVRNLRERRRLEWAQIVTVRFGGGAPWGLLDLSDGETLTVMALQRSDGAYGETAARRLATLVELHTRTARND